MCKTQRKKLTRSSKTRRRRRQAHERRLGQLKACADVNNAGGSGKPRGGDYDSAPAATWKPQATGTGVLPPPRATGAARNGTEGAVKAPIVTAGASSVVAKGFAAALVAALFL
ncbi:hypothetical protein MCOR26_010899 [Pyricularia oryzae]|nr:hypothetical protein MCOR26_010899 [Pyricularia oryzae]